MLDDLLGRTELKERIETLEEEKRHLERELEAEADRRREAVSARQDAEERVNRLEDRIADLEGRVADATGDREEVAFRHRTTLRGGRVGEVLRRLRSVDTDAEGALSAFIADGHDVPEPVRDALGTRAALVERAAPCAVYADDAGLVAVGLRPVVPPEPFAAWEEGFRAPHDWYRPIGEYGLALVRSDLFALGRYDAGERGEVTGFTTDVKSDHSKGGFSQGRFERLREGQIRDHLDRVHDALADAPDRLFVVGESALLGEFADRATATRAVDATGAPAEALKDAHRSFWTVRCYGL